MTVFVHPKSSQKKIVVTSESFDIYISEPPDKGKANNSVIKELGIFFSFPSNSIKIIKGQKSRTKLILLEKKEEEAIKQILKNKIVEL